MAALSTVGVALWPGMPKPQVTAMTLCRQSRSIAAGTADGSIWLWRTPAEWHPFPKVGRQLGQGVDTGAGDGLQPLAVLCGQHEAPITSLITICEDRQHVLFSADSSGCMCVWRLQDGVCLKTSNVLAWGPRAMVNVSCKGKSLIACCGPSPDIEVIDIGPMKRIVRLFGHGDWCADLCVRPRETLMEADVQSSREPSIYSLDHGGTLCVWLAERTCSPTIVGWVPSVQCHRVAIACPTSLVLDKNCAALMVMGQDATAHYRLGRDHRFANKSAPPQVFTFSNTPAADTPSAAAPPCEGVSAAHTSDGGAKGEPDTEASKAPETAAQRRAKRLASAAKRCVGPGGLANCMPTGTWGKVQGVLSPGGERAVVWRPNDGLLLLRTQPDGRTEVERLSCRAALNIAAVCSDASGWFAFASRSGDLCVWSADSLPPAPHLSAVSALRSRHAVSAGTSVAPAPMDGEGTAAVEHEHAANGRPSDDGRTPLTTAALVPADGHPVSLPGADAARSTDSTVMNTDVSGVDVAAAFAELSREWKFQGAGWLAKGFYEHINQAAGGGGADEDSWLAPGREECASDCPGVAARPHANAGTHSQTSPAACGGMPHRGKQAPAATVSIIHVEGLAHGGSVRRGMGGDASGSGRRTGRCRTETGVYWVVGDAGGCVSVMTLPAGSLLVRLEGHAAAVLSLLWVDGEDLLVSGGADGGVVVWDMPDGVLRHRLSQTPSAILKLVDLGTSVDVFLKRACVLFALAADGSVLVFSAKSGGESRDGEGGAGVGGGAGVLGGGGWRDRRLERQGAQLVSAEWPQTRRGRCPVGPTAPLPVRTDVRRAGVCLAPPHQQAGRAAAAGLAARRAPRA
jgi:WD40 repeat protein